MHFRTSLCLAAALLVPPGAAAATLVVEADRDATLIESADGTLANGAGTALFAGRTNQSVGSVRRALLHFDLPAAPALERGGVVEGVALVVHVMPGNPGPRELLLFRVLADWSEGPSASSGGIGVPAGPGDVTWLHASHEAVFWPVNGGLFDGRVLASTVVDGEGLYRFESAELTRLVMDWLARPGENFGILVAGDETAPQTSKAIASRENPDPLLWPVLEIRLRPRSGAMLVRPGSSLSGR